MAFRPSMGGIGSLGRGTSVSGVGEPMNTDELIAHLVEMTPAQRAQYAAAHSGDTMLLSVAKYVDNKFKENAAHLAARQTGTLVPVNQQAVSSMAGAQPQQMQQTAQGLPEESGIGALPVKNMQHMAGGGIVAFGDGGDVPGFQSGGRVGPYEAKIRAEALRQGADPDLMVRMFSTESRGNPDAVSPKGAAGLGQLMPDAAKEMGLTPKERFDPNKNIPASVAYFKKQLAAFGGDPEKAAAAYNWGPGNLKKHLAKKPDDWKIGLPKETAEYLTALLPIGSARAEETPPAAPAEADQAQKTAGTRDATTADLQALRKSSNLGDKVDTAGQVLRSLGQNAFARVAGGLSGLAGAMTPGAEGQGADYAKRVQEYLSYHPEAITEDSKKILGVLGAPLEYANKYVGVPAGDYLAEQGLPVAASIARALPEAAFAAVPLALRGARATGGAKPAAVEPAAAAPVAPPVRTVPTPAQVAAANTAVPIPQGLARVNQAAKLREQAATQAAQDAAAAKGPQLPPLVGPPKPTGIAALPEAAALRTAAEARAKARAAERAAETEAAAGKAVAPEAAAPAAAAAAEIPAMSRMAAARAAIGEGRGLLGLVPAMVAAGTGVSNQEAPPPPEPVGGAGAANPMELDPAQQAGPQEPVSIAKEPEAKAAPTAEAAPAKNPNEWTADDWLALAAGLGQNESQYFSHAVGKGLASLVANRQARLKADRENALTKAQIADLEGRASLYPSREELLKARTSAIPDTQDLRELQARAGVLKTQLTAAVKIAADPLVKFDPVEGPKAAAVVASLQRQLDALASSAGGATMPAVPAAGTTTGWGQAQRQ